MLCGILLDEGYLTDLRTALAGAVVASVMVRDRVALALVCRFLLRGPFACFADASKHA